MIICKEWVRKNSYQWNYLKTNESVGIFFLTFIMTQYMYQGIEQCNHILFQFVNQVLMFSWVRTTIRRAHWTADMRAVKHKKRVTLLDAIRIVIDCFWTTCRLRLLDGFQFTKEHESWVQNRLVIVLLSRIITSRRVTQVNNWCNLQITLQLL